MKKMFLLLIFLISLHSGFSQSTDQKILDSISQKTIYYIQQKMPDSIYSIAGQNFRSKLSLETFKDIMLNQVLTLNDFKDVSFVKTVNAINKYKVNGSPELQLLIGLDKDNKLETFLVQPFSDN